MHFVNTVIPILPEVPDLEVTLLFPGLWRWRVVPVGRTCGPVQLSLWPLQGTTCKDDGVVAHVRRGECFADQVSDPVPELVMMCCDKAAPLSINDMTD